MKIEATHMIDRCRRAHMALMANCMEEQNNNGISSDRFLQLEDDITHCANMINTCEEKLQLVNDGN